MSINKYKPKHKISLGNLTKGHMKASPKWREFIEEGGAPFQNNSDYKL